MICTIIYLVVSAIITVCLLKANEHDKCFHFVTSALIIMCVVLIPPAIGAHYEGNEDLINDRLYIMETMNSDNPELREQAVARALEYNKKVASGKQALANPWINWFVDHIWRDAELIPLDYSDVRVKE